jgi:hypothetical protein
MVVKEVSLMGNVAKHLAASDWELLAQLQRKADEHRDGHLTICKFTTNWRIGFVAPISPAI